MILEIGTWINRHYDDRRYAKTKPHFVESIIDGAAITHCGRRMEQHTRAKVPNKLVQVIPLWVEKCKKCR